MPSEMAACGGVRSGSVPITDLLGGGSALSFDIRASISVLLYFRFAALTLQKWGRLSFASPGGALLLRYKLDLLSRLDANSSHPIRIRAFHSATLPQSQRPTSGRSVNIGENALSPTRAFARLPIVYGA
jgi:hypothetical protein